MDLSGDRPQLDGKIVIAEIGPAECSAAAARQSRGGPRAWARSVPSSWTSHLTGFAQEIALKKVDLRAGTLNSAELRLTGSVENLIAQRGIDLKFSLRGKELAKLKEIIAQPYIFVPVPGQGAYAISGNVSDPAADNFKVNDFKFVLADTKLIGRLDFNLAGQLPVYEVQLSGPKFNLKPFPIPKESCLRQPQQNR